MARFKKLDIPHQWKDEFTKYPHGYSIFESISKWVKQVNALIRNINQWNEYLGGFTSTFGEVPQQMVELRQEMTGLINSVNSDLTTIINEVNGLADTLLSHLTNYASYLESELGEEHIIRSLPNGVKDEIDLTQRKIIKRTKKYIIQARDITPRIILHTDTGIWCAIIQIPSDGLYSIPINERARLERYSGNLISFYSSAGQLGFPVDEETTIEQAREMLVGMTLIYQLAEPEIIDLPEHMTPNTREIVRLSEQVDKLINML